jgi:hypothetical protein
MKLENLSSLKIIITLQLLPSLLPETLAGSSTPFDARGGFLPIDVLPALTTCDLEFIGEYLDFSTTVRALVKCYSKIPTILAGAFTVHNLDTNLQI